jgi:hypothetical protein
MGMPPAPIPTADEQWTTVMQSVLAAPSDPIPVLEEFLGRDGLKAILAAPPSFAPAAEPSPAPTPAAERWPAPIGPAAYYGVVGTILRLLAPHTESDPAALLLQLLAAIGNLMGRTAYFVAEATRHYSNLFVVIVGRTAKGRKGTSWGHILALMTMLSEQWRRDCVASGMQSGEGLIHHVRDPVIRMSDDGPVTEDPGVEDKRLLVVETEMASVIRRFEQSGNSLSAVIRQAWDDGCLRSLTRNSPARATDAHISIIGHITQDEMLRVMPETELANGYANRYLPVLSRRSQMLPEGGRSCSIDWTPVLHQLAAAWEHASSVGELRRDADSRDIWISVYPHLSADRGGMLGAVTSRGEAQVMRLALVYALLDCSSVIRREHLEAALAVWAYCDESAAIIYGDSLGDVVADTILRGLRQRGAAGMTRTEITALLQHNRTAAQLDRALALLERCGRARSVTTSPPKGKPTTRYYAITATTPAHGGDHA